MLQRGEKVWLKRKWNKVRPEQTWINHDVHEARDFQKLLLQWDEHFSRRNKQICVERLRTCKYFHPVFHNSFHFTPCIRFFTQETDTKLNPLVESPNPLTCADLLDHREVWIRSYYFTSNRTDPRCPVFSAMLRSNTKRLSIADHWFVRGTRLYVGFLHSPAFLAVFVLAACRLFSTKARILLLINNHTQRRKNPSRNVCCSRKCPWIWAELLKMLAICIICWPGSNEASSKSDFKQNMSKWIKKKKMLLTTK